MMATAAVVLAAGGTFVAALRRRYAVVVVDGRSMYPTLHDGDRVLMCRVRPAAVRPGQVVVLAAGGGRRTGRTRLVVKRVAALPGQPLPAGLRAAGGEPTVPPGRLVLLGDNAAASIDSRTCGYYRLGEIRGVVLRSLQPRRRRVMPAREPDLTTVDTR